MFVNICLNVIFYMFVNIQVFPFDFMPQTVPQQPPVVRQLCFEPVWFHNHLRFYWYLLKDLKISELLLHFLHRTHHSRMVLHKPRSLSSKLSRSRRLRQYRCVCVWMNMCEKLKTQASIKLWFHNINTPSVLHLARMCLTKMRTCECCMSAAVLQKQPIMWATHLLIIYTFFQVSTKPWRYCLGVSELDSFIFILNCNIIVLILI